MSEAEVWEISEGEGLMTQAYPKRTAKRKLKDGIIEVERLSKDYPPDLKAVESSRTPRAHWRTWRLWQPSEPLFRPG